MWDIPPKILPTIRGTKFCEVVTWSQLSKSLFPCGKTVCHAFQNWLPQAVLKLGPNTCLLAALSVGNIQARGFVVLLILIGVFILGALDLKWCVSSWRVAVFKAHEHELRCSRCFQRRIWEQTSDCLNSFVDGGEETKKRVDQLGFTSNGLLNPSAYWTHRRSQFLLKLFQASPKSFVCWTARFKRDMYGWRAKLRYWKMMTEFVRHLASCTTGCPHVTWRTQCGAASW